MIGCFQHLRLKEILYLFPVAYWVFSMGPPTDQSRGTKPWEHLSIDWTSLKNCINTDNSTDNSYNLFVLS